MLPLVDAALMGGALADGVLLVARHGRTGCAQLAEAADRLSAMRAPLLGVVLTRVPRGGAMAPAGGRAYRPDAVRARAATPVAGRSGPLE